MSLSNQQFEAILKEYAQTRDDNRHLLERRRFEIAKKIPTFDALDAKIREISMDRAKKLLDGDDSALSLLHDELQEIISHKKALLQKSGYPENYLEPIYTCPDCEDTGYILMSDQTRAKCHCLRNREISVLYEQSNIQNLLSHENFSTLSYEYYQGESLELFKYAVETSKNFIENFAQDYQNLFFYGTVGTGKSFLSGCIAGELLKQGYSVIYFSSVGLFNMLAQYTFDSQSKDKLYSFYEDLYNSDLIIIDDLGTELTNSFVASQLFSCLNERNLRSKATIISTNLSLEELRDQYSDRVFSRIVRNYTLCKLTGPDIRIIKKRGTHT